MKSKLWKALLLLMGLGALLGINLTRANTASPMELYWNNPDGSITDLVSGYEPVRDNNEKYWRMIQLEKEILRLSPEKRSARLQEIQNFGASFVADWYEKYATDLPPGVRVSKVTFLFGTWVEARANDGQGNVNAGNLTDRLMANIEIASLDGSITVTRSAVVPCLNEVLSATPVGSPQELIAYIPSVPSPGD